MKKAILITEENWEELANAYGLFGLYKSQLIDRYYILDNSSWWRKLLGQRRAVLVGEPAFEGDIVRIGRGKQKWTRA